MTPEQLEKIVGEVLSRKVLALIEANTEALAFLRSIEGHGYGGMSDYDCAVASLERALAAPDSRP